jgi:SPP1 gp7 family putative phage head morphogenesis protein
MSESNGIIARALAAVRYVATGSTPDVWFGAGTPMTPQAPEEVKYRAYDFPFSVNLNYIPRATEPVGFKKLKYLADNCDPLRLVMQRQIDLVKALEWTIKPKYNSDSDKTDPNIKKLTTFFERPDQQNDWPQYLNALLEQLFVYDAVTIYKWDNRGGGIYALELKDGSTITPLVDKNTGRRPIAPDPAYQQIFKGLPAVQFTSDELLYVPEHFRVDRRFGYSRVEQIINTAETMIEAMKSELGYYRNGNIGDGFFTAPPNTSAENVLALDVMWNDLMSIGSAERRKLPFLPEGVMWHTTKAEVFNEAFREWLIKLACFTFGTSPQPFLKQTGLGHGGSATQQQSAQEGGLQPVMEYLRRLFNRIIADWFQCPHLEFSWVEDREFDPKIASDIIDQKLKTGRLTLNEARDLDGNPEVEGGDVPLIYFSSGAVRLQDAVADLAPVEPALPVAADVAPPAPEDQKKTPELAKAATGEEVISTAVAKYLAAKSKVISATIVGALGLTKADEDANRKIEAALNGVDWDWSDLPPIVEPALAGVAVAAGKDAVSELGLFDPALLKRVTSRATAIAEDRAAQLVGMKWVDGELVANPDAAWSISETTRTMLRGLITDAVETGKSGGQLSKDIREASAFSKDRADMIARTEAAYAKVQGEVVGWKESGVVGGKQWNADAENCCDECADVDGTIIGIDDEFPLGDPPAHPNCRCNLLAVLIDDMPNSDASE